MSSPSSPYADCEPGEQIIRLVSKLHESVVACSSAAGLALNRINGPQDFHSKVDNLQEVYYEAAAQLRQWPLGNHHYYWIFTIDSLVDLLIRYKHFYDQRLLTLQYEGNPIIDGIGAKLSKLSGDLSGLLVQFVNSPQLDLGKFTLVDFSVIFNKFASVVMKSLELLFIEKSGEAQYFDHSSVTLNALAKLIANFYIFISQSNDAGHQELVYKAFPILTEFVKVSYIAGESKLILPFLSTLGHFPQPVINPKFPIELIHNSRVQLATLIDFYRFTAFNLVTLSVVSEGAIQESYNKQADFYFKVLYGFPNLSRGSYTELAGSNELKVGAQTDDDNRLVSLNERQEISLMFILNYLIGLEDLRQIVSPSSELLSELSFLENSLSSCMRSELYESTSRSQSSRSSSVVSLPRTSSNISPPTTATNKPFGGAKFNFLSSIIVHGSYKEKLTLIVNFLKFFYPNKLDIPTIVSNLNLNPDGETRESDFQHLLANIDKAAYPGKVFYAETLFKISQLLKALGIKHLVESGGLNSISESALNSMFSCNNSIESTCSVKRILNVTKTTTDSDGAVLYFTIPSSEYVEFNDDKFVARQIDTVRLTNQLKLAALNLESVGGEI